MRQFRSFRKLVSTGILASGFLLHPIPFLPAAESGVPSAESGVPSAESKITPAGLVGTPTETGDGAIAASFALQEPQKILNALEKAVKATNSIKDRKTILVALADLEERLGEGAAAAAHYHDAAFADPAARDDNLLLDSARCLLQSGDVSGADSAIRAVLLGNFDAVTLMRARAYAAIVSLTGPSVTDDSVKLVRALAENPQFRQWAPTLLFTLWWTGADQGARDTLIRKWPTSQEALVASGKIALSPTPFWFLSPRDEESVRAFASSGIGAVEQPTTTAASPASVKTATASVVPNGAPSSSQTGASPYGPRDWQQVGFFRYREYAEDLVKALGQAGFSAEIRDQKRPSGTVYFAVLVPEDEKRSTAERLKDAGFESFLVTE